MRRLLDQAMKISTLSLAGDNAERTPAQLQQPPQKQKHLSTRPRPLSSRPPKKSAIVSQRKLRAQRRRALLMLPLQLQLALPPLSRNLHLHRMCRGVLHREWRRRWRKMPSWKQRRRLPLPHQLCPLMPHCLNWRKQVRVLPLDPRQHPLVLCL